MACAAPQSAVDLLPLLFRRPLDRHQMAFALGEALAHLHYLMVQGALDRVLRPGRRPSLYSCGLVTGRE